LGGGAEQREAFEKIKEYLMSPPMLRTGEAEAGENAAASGLSWWVLHQEEDSSLREGGGEGGGAQRCSQRRWCPARLARGGWGGCPLLAPFSFVPHVDGC
jgi:hypothetical protein